MRSGCGCEHELFVKNMIPADSSFNNIDRGSTAASHRVDRGRRDRLRSTLFVRETGPKHRNPNVLQPKFADTIGRPFPPPPIVAEGVVELTGRTSSTFQTGATCDMIPRSHERGRRALNSPTACREQNAQPQHHCRNLAARVVDNLIRSQWCGCKPSVGSEIIQNRTVKLRPNFYNKKATRSDDAKAAGHPAFLFSSLLTSSAFKQSQTPMTLTVSSMTVRYQSPPTPRTRQTASPECHSELLVRDAAL